MKAPKLSLSALTLAVAGMLGAAPALAQQAEQKLSSAEKEQAKKIYFERCAGCHGVLRKGATGKNLEPHWTRKLPDGTTQEGGTVKLGTGRLEKIIGYGTEGGMVNFDDILTKDEISLMARYIQEVPDVPPEFSMKDMLETWKVIVPVAERPKKQMNKFNLKNMFSVTLRDTGEVALIDGDTKEIVSIVKTGYAVHISRLSKSGRYIYVIGRDGRLSLIDLWMEKPAVVAEVKVGFDARSVDTGGRRIPPRAARGLDRLLRDQARVGGEHQGNRADPASRLLRHQEPEGHHHRVGEVPARRRLGCEQALLPRRG